MPAPPDARLVAPPGGAVEPLVHAPEAVQSLGAFFYLFMDMIRVSGLNGSQFSRDCLRLTSEREPTMSKKTEKKAAPESEGYKHALHPGFGWSDLGLEKVG